LTGLMFFFNNHDNLVLIKFLFKKINEVLNRVLFRVDLNFLPSQVELIIPLFFLKLGSIQAPG
jgi:hypothetical protein